MHVCACVSCVSAGHVRFLAPGLGGVLGMGAVGGEGDSDGEGDESEEGDEGSTDDDEDMEPPHTLFGE